MAGHVEDAVAKGATVLAGGRRRPDVGPLFYAPTVLTGVTEEMRCFDEETFGPVVSLYRFGDADEAVERINASSYGLNASVWTRRAAHGRALAARIEAGTVNVNEAYAAAFASMDAPMGGMKRSGMGRRHGAHGMQKYTEAQTIAVQRLMALAPPMGPHGELYARAMTAGLRILGRAPGVR